MTLRKASERGTIEIDWLKAQHSFSFGSYFDPNWMGFRSLRVINDDFIQPTGGFPTHPHRDMEIITFIIDGAMEHKDTLGSHSQILPGEIQIMSAGTGIQHSEYNPSSKELTRSLQIWIEPSQTGVKPRYEQYKYKLVKNELCKIVTPSGGENIAKVYQDMQLSVAEFTEPKSIDLNESRYYWVQAFGGSATLNGYKINDGDGFAIEKEKTLNFEHTQNFKFLLFDLA